MRKRLIRSAVLVLTAFVLLFASSLVYGESTSDPADRSGTLLVAFGTTKDYPQVTSDYLLLTRLLAAQAIQQGDDVRLIPMSGSIKQPDLNADETLDQRLQRLTDAMSVNLGNKTSSRLTLMKAFCGGLEKQAANWAEPVDFWLLSPDARIQAAYSAEKGMFIDEKDSKAEDIINAFSRLLSLHPDMTLHLVWHGEDALAEGNRYLDDALLEALGESSARVTVHISAPSDAPEQSGMLVFRHTRDLNAALPETASTGNVYTWQHNGQDALLCLTGVTPGLKLTCADAALPTMSLATTSDVGGDTEALPGDSVVELPEGVTLIRQDDKAWLLLHQVPTGELTLTDQADFRVQAYMHMDAVTLTVLLADGTPLPEQLTWYREANQLLVSAAIPEALAGQASFSMAGGSVPLEAAPRPYANGTAEWLVTVPSLAAGSHQLDLSMQLGPDVWLTMNAEPIPCQVDNRSPEMKTGQTEFVTYAGIPGASDAVQTLTVDLNTLFADPDHDSLTFTASPAWKGTINYQFAVTEHEASFTPLKTDASSVDVELSVSDGSSAPYTCLLTFRQLSATDALKDWQMTPRPTSAIDLPYDSELQLTFVLSDMDAALYDAMVAQRSQVGDALPPLEQALTFIPQLTLTDGTPVPADLQPQGSTTRLADGSLQYTVTLPATRASLEAKLTVSAVLNGLALPNLLSPVTMTLTNAAPKAAEGFTDPMPLSAELDDMPNSIKQLDMQLTGDKADFIPASLFVDDHPEQLACTLIVAGPGTPVLLDKQGNPIAAAGSETSFVWTLDAAQSASSVTLQLNEVGSYTVTLTAADDEERAAEELPAMTWQIRVSSKLTGLLIKLIIIVAAVIVLAVAGLIVWQVTRPRFVRGSRIGIRVHGMENAVGLEACGKKSVTLAQLLISAQLYPPRSMPLNMLTDIVVSPCRGGAIRVCVGRKAANALNLPAKKSIMAPGNYLTLAQIDLVYLSDVASFGG